MQLEYIANGTPGTITTVSPATPLPTTSSSTIPGTGATSLGKAEDAVAADGDTGVSILAVRNDVPTVNQNTNGDYSWPTVDKYGALYSRAMERVSRTYSSAIQVTAAAAATDIATLTGGAGGTVFVTKVIITATQTTAGLVDVQLILRSTVDTGGTSTAGTAVTHQIGDAAATGTVLNYSVNPASLGTAVGSIRRSFLPVAGATSVVNPLVVFEFGERGKPIMLAGVAQQLAVNLNGATLAGNLFDVTFEWYEI